MKKFCFVLLYLIIFQPFFAKSEEDIYLKCTGQTQVRGELHVEDRVTSIIYNKKLKKILLDGFPIGGVISHHGWEGYSFPYPTDPNDLERYNNPSYSDKENFTYSWCFDYPSKPELDCEYKLTENSEIKTLITLSLDRVSGNLNFTENWGWEGKDNVFRGNCEKVDKLF